MPKKSENIRTGKNVRFEGYYENKIFRNKREILYEPDKCKGQNKNTLKKLFCNDAHLMPSEITFETLLRMWQESNEIRLKGGTKNRYDNLINTHIVPELGELKLSEITSKTINSFLNKKLKSGRIDGKGGLSSSYVRSISLVITSALNYAVSEELLEPFKTKIKKPSPIKNELSILSFENQKALEQRIKSEPSPTNIGIMISLYTGLRIGEICALCWNDIDLSTRTIYIRHTVSRVRSTKDGCKTELILDEPKTASSKRVLPIPTPLFSVLLDCRKEAKSSYVVSNTKNFVSPRTYDARFHKVLNDCNIEDFNYHALRHTFATRCIEVGVDIKSLSEILGHANVSTTLNTYVHSSIEMKKSQLEKLALLSV